MWGSKSWRLPVVAVALLSFVGSASTASGQEAPSQNAPGRELSQQAAPSVVLRPGSVNGAEPMQGYLIGRDLHRGGTTVRLPHDYAQVGGVGTHVIGARNYHGNGVATVEILNSGGSVVLTSQLRWGFAISDDHSVAAWIGPRGRVHTWTEAEGHVLLAKLRPGARARDVNGSMNCRESAGGTCTVYFDLARRAWSTNSAGVTRVVARDSLVFADATDGGRKLAYLITVRDAGSCSRIRPGFRTCKHSFGRFADDGKRIIAYDDYRDGIGDRFVDMLSSRADRAELRVNVPNGGYLAQVIWEDNNTWVINAWVAGQAQLYRVNSDGSWQRIAPAVNSEDVDNPYRLVQ